MTLTTKRLSIGLILLLISPLLKILVDTIFLEPLGVYDIHVSQIPEGPNYCTRVSEVWYRYCWDIRESSSTMPLNGESEKFP